MSFGSSASKSVSPQAQVVVFEWTNQVATEDLSWDQLSDSSALDLSHEIHSVTYSKDLGGEGSFNITLPATQAWGDRLRPGMWLGCWMSQNQDLALPDTSHGGGVRVESLDKLARQGDRLRFIGVITRVAGKVVIGDDGKPEAFWEVTGVDFTIVYSGCSIWINYFYAESSIIDTVATLLPVRTDGGAQTVTELLGIIHSLFYEPQKFGQILNQDPKNPIRKSLSEVGFQWLLPTALLRATGMRVKAGRSSAFWGNIEGITDFAPTLASRPVANPAGFLSGNALAQLRTYSIPELHELFTEISESGVPQIVFRPIPWKSNAKGYPHFAPLIKSLVDIWSDGGQFTLSAMDICELDIGEDSHSRANHFLAVVQTNGFGASDNISELQFHPSPAGRTFPLAQHNSIARYGMFPSHFEFDTFIQLAANDDGRVDSGLLSEANEILFDYNNNAIFLGSGSCTIVGNPRVKVGRAVLFDSDVSLVGRRLAYVEGYTDSFTVLENGCSEWSTVLKLTRVASIDAYANALGLSGADDVKTNFGNAKAIFKERASYTPKK